MSSQVWLCTGCRWFNCGHWPLCTFCGLEMTTSPSIAGSAVKRTEAPPCDGNDDPARLTDAARMHTPAPKPSEDAT